MRSALVLGAYLLGAIPFGLLLTRLWVQEDVRRVGSGNIGATNVARAAGKGAAGIVLLLDMIKGFAPAWIAARALGPGEAWWTAAVGMAAFAGHVFPLYLGFRGGKGVATALGFSLAVAPLAALAGVAVYVSVYGASRISSLGSLCAAVTVASFAFVVVDSPPYAWAILAMVAVVIIRHRSNLERLLRRQEGKV